MSARRAGRVDTRPRPARLRHRRRPRDRPDLPPRRRAARVRRLPAARRPEGPRPAHRLLRRLRRDRRGGRGGTAPRDPDVAGQPRLGRPARRRRRRAGRCQRGRRATCSRSWREQYADDVAGGRAGRDGRAARRRVRRRRGDGPVAGRDYHLPAGAGRSPTRGPTCVTALTLTTAGRGDRRRPGGRARPACPVSVGFTVETDGRLPDGTTLRAAVEAVDDVGPPDWFVVNCAHPSHVAAALADAGPWVERIGGTRVNASALQPRRARRGRRRSTRATRVALGPRPGRARGDAARAARRRRLLRHRRPARRGDVGGHDPAGVTGGVRRRRGTGPKGCGRPCRSSCHSR